MHQGKYLQRIYCSFLNFYFSFFQVFFYYLFKTSRPHLPCSLGNQKLREKQRIYTSLESLGCHESRCSYTVVPSREQGAKLKTKTLIYRGVYLYVRRKLSSRVQYKYALGTIIDPVCSVILVFCWEFFMQLIGLRNSWKGSIVPT